MTFDWPIMFGALLGKWLNGYWILIFQFILAFIWVRDLWRWKKRSLPEKSISRYSKRGISQEGIGIYCKGLMIFQVISLILLGIIFYYYLKVKSEIPFIDLGYALCGLVYLAGLRQVVLRKQKKNLS